LCHVSNTGNPNSQEVNVQVQWMRGGAGHENHCADFLPGTELIGLPIDPALEITCDTRDERCSCEVAIERWVLCDTQ
jgi:hypothetical protein